VIFVRSVSQKEEAELRRMTRQEIGRVSQRAHMILLSLEQRTVPEISKIFAVNRATVRYWIEQFDVYGPAGLHDGSRRGRPRKLTKPSDNHNGGPTTSSLAVAGFLVVFLLFQLPYLVNRMQL
jgi:hypothetical protein